MSTHVPSQKITGGIRPLGASRTAQFSHWLQKTAAIAAAGLCLGSYAAQPAHARAATEQYSSAIVATAPHAETRPSMALASKRADFLGEIASTDARQVADWVVDTGDNRGMPFVIVDKKNTKVFVFKGNGYLIDATPALLGLAKGDDNAPGIGDRKLSQIRPDERTTPAGRFVASLGRNLGPHEFLWVDYAAALSLHRVLAAKTEEHRLQRLAAASPLDRRITFGCINVPVKFFDRVVHPAFSRTNGIVYILPEIKSIPEVFFNPVS